jgi:hypothetical protein
MRQPARFPYTDSPHDEATRDRRDPVVVQAIENVTYNKQMDEWWALSPGVRTHAIYVEIRRLDQAWANGPIAPIEETAGGPGYQMV